VRRDSPWSSFAELEGTTWAYNEETSHSGYTVTRHRLAQMGRDRGFFGRVMATGSHEASLRLLLQGDVDASAVDSTVLDLLHLEDASLAERLRIVESLGPSPSPPWVIARTVPQELRTAIRDAILAMADDPRGRLSSLQAWLRGSRSSRTPTTTRSGGWPRRGIGWRCRAGGALGSPTTSTV
jgi:phosphonate transport system substrate-binding protein